MRSARGRSAWCAVSSGRASRSWRAGSASRPGRAARQFPGLVVAAFGQAARRQRHRQHPLRQRPAGVAHRGGQALGQCVGQLDLAFELEGADEAVPGEGIVGGETVCSKGGASRRHSPQRSTAAGSGSAQPLQRGRGVAKRATQSAHSRAPFQPRQTSHWLGRAKRVRSRAGDIGSIYWPRWSPPPPRTARAGRSTNARWRRCCAGCAGPRPRPGCTAKWRAAWRASWKSSVAAGGGAGLVVFARCQQRTLAPGLPEGAPRCGRARSEGARHALVVARALGRAPARDPGRSSAGAGGREPGVGEHGAAPARQTRRRCCRPGATRSRSTAS